MLRERLSGRAIVAGLSGSLGVSLIVLQSQARLDILGILAAFGGTLSMASGIVLAKKWGQPAPPLTTTAWQLMSGGLTLLVLMLVFEGLPATPLTSGNVWGYACLSMVGTAFAFVMWFRGIARLPKGTAAFVGLLSPVVAIILGGVVAGEQLSALQLGGVVIVLGSIAAAVAATKVKRVSDAPLALVSSNKTGQKLTRHVGDGHRTRLPSAKRPSKISRLL